MRTLQEGDRGAIVDLLQWGLRRAGGSLQVDGVFGAATLRALQRFQKARGLVPDGVAGPRTWSALRPWLTGLHSRTVVPTRLRWSVDLLELVLQGLSARYSFLQINTIGVSPLGRAIWQVTIGQGSHRVGYNAAHHANEWITTPVLLKFLEQYAAGVAHGGVLGGADCRTLYEKYTLDIVPMVNPDGVDLVTGALEETSDAYRSAREIASGFPDIPFPSGWKANIQGLDLNLAYPARWEEAKRLKYAQGFDRPAPRDFVGPAPLAPPESRAMYDRAREADYRLILAYHTQGRVIYWKYDDRNPPGAYALVRRMEEASGYRAEITPAYSANAGYKDWFIQEYNRPGYTIEAGEGQSPLPLSQFDEIYRDNLGILLLGMVGLEE